MSVLKGEVEAKAAGLTNLVPHTMAPGNVHTLGAEGGDAEVTRTSDTAIPTGGGNKGTRKRDRDDNGALQSVAPTNPHFGPPGGAPLTVPDPRPPLTVPDPGTAKGSNFKKTGPGNRVPSGGARDPPQAAGGGRDPRGLHTGLHPLTPGMTSGQAERSIDQAGKSSQDPRKGDHFGGGSNASASQGRRQIGSKPSPLETVSKRPEVDGTTLMGGRRKASSASRPLTIEIISDGEINDVGTTDGDSHQGDDDGDFKHKNDRGSVIACSKVSPSADGAPARSKLQPPLAQERVAVTGTVPKAAAAIRSGVSGLRVESSAVRHKAPVPEMAATGGGLTGSGRPAASTGPAGSTGRGGAAIASSSPRGSLAGRSLPIPSSTAYPQDGRDGPRKGRLGSTSPSHDGMPPPPWNKAGKGGGAGSGGGEVRAPARASGGGTASGRPPVAPPLRCLSSSSPAMGTKAPAKSTMSSTASKTLPLTGPKPSASRTGAPSTSGSGAPSRTGSPSTSGSGAPSAFASKPRSATAGSKCANGLLNPGYLFLLCTLILTFLFLP